MSKKNAKKTNTPDCCHRIWEGSVGICIKAQKTSSGEYFWKYTLVRCYKTDDEWKYDQYFSRKNDEALAVVLSKGMQFMDELDPADFLDAVLGQHQAAA